MTSWQSLSELSMDLGELVDLLTLFLLPTKNRCVVIFDRLMHALLGLYG